MTANAAKNWISKKKFSFAICEGIQKTSSCDHRKNISRHRTLRDALGRDTNRRMSITKQLNITNLTSYAVAEFQNDNKILKEQFKMLKKLIFYQDFNIILKFCNCITGQVCYAGLPSCWHSSGGFVWKAPRHSAWQQIKCNTQHKGSVVMLRVTYGECHLCSKSWHRLKAAFLLMPSCLNFFIKTLWKWITQDLL